MPQKAFVDITLRLRRGPGATIARYRRLLADQNLTAGPVSICLEEQAVVLSASVKDFSEPQAEALAAALSGDPEALGPEALPHVR